MKKRVYEIFQQMLVKNPDLQAQGENILKAYEIIDECYQNGGKVLICGNGGSAADSEHIVGELMKGFILRRPINNKMRDNLQKLFPNDGQYLADNLQGALPAISLVSHTSLASAYINDIQADMVFAQQVFGYGRQYDVLLGISTSGNSANVLNAVKIAKSLELKTIGLTGENGGKMKKFCDVTICAPDTETYRIQEYHLPIYHALCAMIEENFFGI